MFTFSLTKEKEFLCLLFFLKENCKKQKKKNRQCKCFRMAAILNQHDFKSYLVVDELLPLTFCWIQQKSRFYFVYKLHLSYIPKNYQILQIEEPLIFKKIKIKIKYLFLCSSEIYLFFALPVCNQETLKWKSIYS